jgi:excinuclease ABC subunit C
MVVVTVLDVVRRLPASPGVYRMRDANGRSLYIGRAADLRRRVSSYWGDLRDRPHLRRMVPRVVRVEAAVCDSDHEAAWLERNLLEQSKPSWNRIIGGLEVPVYIRLVLIGRSADITVAHEAGPTGVHFGPYLGGQKVRLAVSGLRRVAPVEYAGERLGGFDRDMARVRGIAPGDRQRLVDAAVAALTGDRAAADALLAELAVRRDAAGAALAYELAGRVQAEIEAFAWVVSTQRVTSDGSGDAELAGWCDGVLVSVGLRSGRVRTWTQRLCAERAATERVAATPAAWRDWVDRSAILAAALVTERKLGSES